MLDTTRAFETPEGIELQLHVAGPVVRACAWFIDILIRMALNMALGVVLVFFGTAGMGFMLIGAFLIEWFYPVIFEVYRGATPGKKMFDLQVVHDDGTPISWQASSLRNFLLVADFLPMMYGFGLMSMLYNRDFKRLGDMAAGTLVIYRPSAGHEYKIPTRPALALPAPLQLSEQRAILDFAERADSLSPERRQELALILQAYSDPTQRYADNPAEPVLRYANWIAHGTGRQS